LARLPPCLGRGAGTSYASTRTPSSSTAVTRSRSASRRPRSKSTEVWPPLRFSFLLSWEQN
jgi:hypothetical protein